MLTQGARRGVADALAPRGPPALAVRLASVLRVQNAHKGLNFCRDCARQKRLPAGAAEWP